MTPVEDATLHRAMLRRRLAFMLGGAYLTWGWLVVLYGGLRLMLASQFGLLLTQFERDRLLSLTIAHLVIAVVGLLLMLQLRLRRSSAAERVLRIGLFLLPVAMLVSLDRVASMAIPPVFHRKSAFVPDADYGWRLRPGHHTDWHMEVDINSKRLRGPEVPYRKNSDEFRILFLGDSVVYGLGIEYPKTFAALLPDALANKVGGRKITIVNSGVGGWSPWQQLIWLKHEGLHYDPDLIVQCFCLNDVTDKFRLQKFGGPQAGHHSAKAVGNLEWSGLFRLARLIRAWFVVGDVNLTAGAQRMADLDIEDLLRTPDDPSVQAAWKVTSKSLDGIVRTCREAGIPLGMICFPFEVQLEKPQGFDAAQRRLAQYCRQNNIPFCDLLPPLRNWKQQQPDPEATLLFDFCHLNEDGHRFVTPLIRDFLLNEKLVP